MTTQLVPDPRPLLIEDLPALRRKLTDPSSLLHRRWQHFKRIAQHQADALPLYSAFVALVEDDHESAARFRTELEKTLEYWPARQRTMHIQYHVWCSIMSLARWAIAYDWVADMPALRGFDLPKAAETFIDAVFSHTYPVMTSRVPAGDNQICSMVLATAVIGYLFGVKRAQDPRAGFLLKYALQRYPQLTEFSDPGFAGEGSAYIDTVNVPVLSLFLALARYLKLPFDDAAVVSCLRTGRNLIGPSGVTLPWDHYGYSYAHAMQGLALLASLTRDPSALRVIEQANLWYGADHGAWNEDVRIWTLAWWPEDLSPEGEAFPSWIHPQIGASLDLPRQRTRLTQLWDFCTGQPNGSTGRAQCDPNAITLEIGGVPMIVDGIPGPECTAFKYDPEKMLTPAEIDDTIRGLKLFRMFTQKSFDLNSLTQSWAYGAVGGSNALVINHEPWHFPRGRTLGRATRWYVGDGLRIVGGDCTAHYAQRYPVRKVERTSILVEDRYALIVDEIDSEQPIDVTWQVYARREAMLDRSRVTIATPEGPALAITPAASDPQLMLEPIDHFPRIGVGHSARVSWTRHLTRGAMVTLLSIHDDERLGVVEDAWEGGLMEGDTPGVTLARGSWRDVCKALAAAPATQKRWLRLRPRPPRGADYIRLRAPAVDAKITWNGRPLPAPPEGLTERISPLTLWLADAHAPVLEIVMKPWRGRLLIDGGDYFRKTEPAFAGIRPSGGDTFRIDLPDRSDELRLTPVLAFRRAGEGWLELPSRPEAFEPESRARITPPAIRIASGDPACPPGFAGIDVAKAIASSDVQQLIGMLDHDDWRVQMAAAIRLGDLGDRSACEALRKRVSAELSQELYPHVPETPERTPWADEMTRQGRDVGVKRFRVAQAAVHALRKLGDRDALPLARQILDDLGHFYPLHHAAVALVGELGDRSDIALLEKWSSFPETNAREEARMGLEKLKKRWAAAS